MKHFLLITISLFLLTSCEKKILEIVPVIQIEKDISIETGKAIKYFSFPSSLVGFAGSDTSFIYKTIDGGDSWKIMNVGTSGNCRGIEFSDDLHGMCLMGTTMFSTNDGGFSWKRKSDLTDFIGITDEGLGLYLKLRHGSCEIYISKDGFQNFELFYTIIDWTIDEFYSARITDNKIFYFTEKTSTEKFACGFDFKSNKEIKIRSSNIFRDSPKDVYLSESLGCLLTNSYFLESSGSILDFSETDLDYSFTYNSVDGYDNLVICVGKGSIISNMDILNENKWNQVYDENGNGFDKTFYKIRFIDNNTFYLSGSNGYLVIGRL